MAETLQPVPYDAPIAAERLASETWLTWFFQLTTMISAVARRIVAVSLSNQHAAILSTPIPTGSLKSGQYRISFYLRVTQPATVSSSAQVTLGWIDGVACSKTFALVNGNLTTSIDTGEIIVDADAPGVLTYSVAYASVGATPMQFKMRIIAEAM